MGWASNMLRKVESRFGQNRNASAIEKAAAKLVVAETERDDKRHEVARLEAAYDEALLTDAETGNETGSDEALAELEEARSDLAKLERVVALRRREHDELRRQAQDKARRDAEVRARTYLAEMDEQLKMIATGAEMIAAGVRNFNASKTRFLEVTPTRPDYTPAVWSSGLERLVQRHIGARCSMFRASVVGSSNLDALAKTNEMLEQHRDVTNQLFPEPPPAKAA